LLSAFRVCLGVQATKI